MATEGFLWTSFGPRKHHIMVAMTRGCFCEAPVPFCWDNSVAPPCRVPALVQCTASVLAVEPRLCIRRLFRDCQHFTPLLSPQQTRPLIVTHHQSLISPVSTCTALSCAAAHLQPRWLQLTVTHLCHSALPSWREPTANCLLPPTPLAVAGSSSRSIV